MPRVDVNYSAYRMAGTERSFGGWAPGLADFDTLVRGPQISFPAGSSGSTTPLYNTLYNQVVSSDNFSRSLNKNDESVNDRDCQCNIRDCSGECQGSTLSQSRPYPKLVICEDVDESGLIMMSRLPYPSNEDNSSVSMVLVNAVTWKSLGQIGNEMLINKLGRRMFPEVYVNVKGLDPGTRYYAFLDFVCRERKKFSFSKKTKSWTGGNENLSMSASTRLFIHPNSPSCGSYWNSHTVQFQDVKLSNSDACKERIISICGMYTYACRVHFIPYNGFIDWPNRVSKTFPETTFYAVTCHKSEELKRLRGTLNPRSMYARCAQSNREIEPILRDSRSVYNHVVLSRKDSKRDSPSAEKSVLKRKSGDLESSLRAKKGRLPNFSESFVDNRDRDSSSTRIMLPSNTATYEDNSSPCDSSNAEMYDDNLPAFTSSEAPIETVAQEYSENVRQEYSENVRQEYSENVRQEYSENVRQEYAENVRQEYAENVGQEFAENVGQEFPKSVKQEPSDNVEQEFSDNVGYEYSERVEQECLESVRGDFPPDMQSFYGDSSSYGSSAFSNGSCDREDSIGQHKFDPVLAQACHPFSGNYTALPQLSELSSAPLPNRHVTLERRWVGNAVEPVTSQATTHPVIYREHQKPDSNFGLSSWGKLRGSVPHDSLISSYYNTEDPTVPSQNFNTHNTMYTSDEYSRYSLHYSEHTVVNMRNLSDTQMGLNSDLNLSEYEAGTTVGFPKFSSVDSCYRYLSGDDTAPEYDPCLSMKVEPSDDCTFQISRACLVD